MDCDLLDVMTLEGERSTHVHGCTQFVQLSSFVLYLMIDFYFLSPPSHVLGGLLNIIQIKSEIQSLLVTPSHTEGRHVL